MITFVYDSTKVEYFTNVDMGSITDAPTSTIDRGLNFADLIVDPDEDIRVTSNDYIVPLGTDFIVDEITAEEEYNSIVFTETTYPFGNINLGGGEGNSATVVFAAKPDPITLREKAIVIRKQAWTGSGTLFEIANGLERTVAPYIGGSGPLRIHGAALDSGTYTFTEDSIKTYGSSIDHGTVDTAVGSSIDYGQTTGVVDEGETNYGDILTGDGLPYGLFKLNGTNVVSNRFKSYLGTGSIKIRGSIDESFIEPFNQIYIVQTSHLFEIYNYIIPDSFTRATYIASGSLFNLSGGLESKVYDYNSGSVAEFGVGGDYGSVDTSATSTTDYGAVTAYATDGEVDNGQVVITDITYPLTGLFKITGGDSAHSRTYGEVGSGNLKTYKGQAVVDAGQASDFAFLPHWRGRGGARIFNATIPDAYSRVYAGSGSLFHLGDKVEKATFKYSSELIGTFIPDIVVLANDTTIIDTSSFINVSLTQNGTGVGSTGGFAIGEHLKFTGGAVDQIRKFDTISLDLRNYIEFEINAIVGTSSNGGEDADPSEDLRWAYSIDGGSTFIDIGILIAETDSAFTGISTGTKNTSIPTGARTGNTIIRIYQSFADGGAFDQWGITDFTFSGINTSYTPLPESVGINDYGTVDQSAGTTEDYGAINAALTNGILDYGQLTNDYSKFGSINIRGSATLAQLDHYTGAIESRIIPIAQNVTILPDEFVNYNSVFAGVQILNSGTGTSSTGGFNIGRHLAFDGTGNISPRNISWTFDAREYDEIAIDVIRGNNSNGGEEPDSGEDLVLSYSVNGGISFNLIGVILAENSTDGLTGTVLKTLTIPEAARTETTIFRMGQSAQASIGIDDYGVTSVEMITNNPSSGFVSSIQPGLFNLSSSTITALQEPTPQVYDVFGSGVLNISGEMSDIRTVKGTYYGSGSLFHIGDKIEKAVFRYTSESVEYVQSSIEHGSINDPVTSVLDQGLVTEATSGEVDNGQVVITETTYPFGKLFEIGGGDIAHGKTKKYVGATLEINISGGYSNLQFSSQVDESTVLFNTSGGDSNSYTKIFTGSGDLFHIGDRVERRTFSYNSSSVTTIEDSIDTGSIVDPVTQSEDYGSVTIITSGGVNYGNMVTVPGDENPFGKLFEISGASIEKFFPKFIWDRESPPIKLFNDQQDQADFRFVPWWRSYGELHVTNGPNGEFNTYAQVRPFIGSGSLFNIGDKLESATYSYNESSVVEFTPGGDYGSIGTSVTSFIDYGSVASVVNQGEYDNGQIVITEITYPLTGLFEFTGAVQSQFIRGPYNAKEGIINIYKGKSAPTDFRFTPWWRSYGELILSSTTETPRSRTHVGSGSLFNIGDKFESVTYDYNESSVVEFTPGGDYGSIGTSVTSFIDYGSITSPTEGGEFDNGQIVITEITYPLTGLFSFTGVGETQFIRGPYSGSGSITYYKGKSAPTDFRFTPWWRGYGELILSSDTHTTRSRDFVGSGSLFHIGDKIESVTYDYNSSSVVEFVAGGNYGTIDSTPTSFIDNGYVNAPTSGGEIDNGQVLITEITYPLTGLFSFSGGESQSRSNNYIGTTIEISISGTAVEKFTSGAGESTALFEFTNGYSGLAFTKGNYTGSGSLFHIGDRIERATFSYNTSSIVDSTEYYDYGNIGTTSISTIDYGTVSTPYYPNTDYGLTLISEGKENPFGLFQISGSAIQPAKLANWVGSGSLFTAKGAAEAAVWQTPEETFLMKFSGGAVEKHVENWVGTGNIKIKEETPLAPNAAVRFRPWWRSYGSINLSGLGDVDDILINYVSRGGTLKLYTNQEGYEWRSYRPSPRYVNATYGQIGGTFTYNGNSDTQKVNVYGYYGDLRDPGTSGSLFTFNSATEVAGYNPQTDTVLFKASGTSPSKWNPAWASRPDGSPRLSGTPQLQLRFNLFGNVDPVDNFKVSGTPDLKITLNYDGSGSLFAVGGSTETLGFNPDTETVLYRTGGRGTTLFSLLHVGSGSLFGFNSAAESSTIDAPTSTVLFTASGSATPVITLNYFGSGTYTANGILDERRTNAYLGEGSLFSAGSAAETKAVSESESTILFVASGGEANAFVRSAVATGNINIDVDADEATTRIYAGEGSLFSVGGASESATVAEESTGLFNFVGNATLNRTKDFVGSGSLFGYSGAAEAAVVSPDLETGLFEISGDGDTSRSRIFTATGSTNVYGSASSSFVTIYAGSGSFSAFGGAAEVAGYDPSEETILYEFTGRASIRSTNKFVGSGSATFVGNVVPVITVSFEGSGTFSAIGGGAESRTIDIENIQLFKASGAATQSFTKGNYDTTGSATISGEVSDIKLTRSNNVFGYVSTNGKAIEKQTDVYIGSGSLFALNSATLARAIDYDETGTGTQGEIVSTNLFVFTGSNPGSITRITQPGTLEISVSGEGITRLYLFSPIRIFGTII